MYSLNMLDLAEGTLYVLVMFNIFMLCVLAFAVFTECKGIIYLIQIQIVIDIVFFALFAFSYAVSQGFL